MKDFYFLTKHDSSGLYLDTCENFEKVTGYKREDVIGKSAYDFFKKSDILDILKSHISSQINKEYNIVKYNLLHKNGNYIIVKTYTIKLNNENLYCFTKRISFIEYLFWKLSVYKKYIFKK